jgi:hypothetical protein
LAVWTHSRPAHHQRKRDKGLLNCIQCASESGCLKEILAALENALVLTVSDVPDFVSRGGMIEFVTKVNKVQFEVNLTAAGKTGLP